MKSIFFLSFLLLTPFINIYAQLDAKDKKAISEYTGHRFKELNKNLRQGKPVPKNEITFYHDLTVALSKLGSFRGVVYRGAYVNINAVNVSKKGGFLSDEAFNSATMDFELGKTYSFDGTAFLEIQSLTARNIIPFSNFPDEKEVVFLPYTIFKSKYVGKIRVKNPLFSNDPNAETKEVDHIKLFEQPRWPNAQVLSLSNGKVLKPPTKFR
jgi:hypothetical protein